MLDREPRVLMAEPIDQSGMWHMAGPGDTNDDLQVNDIAVHRDGYQRFIGWAKLGTIVSFVVAAIVVVIIAQ